MYPANLYGTKFGFEDLPEFVTISIGDQAGGGSGFIDCEPIIYYKLNEPEIYTASPEPIIAIWKTDFDFFDDGSERYTGILGIDSGVYKVKTKYECYDPDCGPEFGTKIQGGRVFIDGPPLETILFREIWNSNALIEYNGPAIIQDSFPESVTISDGSIFLTGMRKPKILFDTIEGGITITFNYCQEFEYLVRPPILCKDSSETASSAGLGDPDVFYPGDSSLYETSNSSYYIYYDYVFSAISPPFSSPLSDSCKWILNTPSGPIAKTGPQNSPLGTYGSFTVS
jgi:hypothetical protein